MERIQVLLDPGEKEQFRRLAQGRGVSLSAWIREAAVKRATEESKPTRLRSLGALRAFFAECDARESGREPDWEEHLEVLAASQRNGLGGPPPVEKSDVGGRTSPRVARGGRGDAAARRPRRVKSK